jgi:hypothetical protein
LIDLGDYLKSLNGQPHCYDDTCIYLAFQEKAANHQSNENQDKLFFDKPIDTET